MPIFRRHNRVDDDEPPDPDERSPQLGLKYKDLQVMGALVDMGARLTDPRHVIYFLYGDDEAPVRAAAEVAGGRGFAVTVNAPSGEIPQWSLRCEEHDVVLSPDRVRGDGDFFDELAATFGLDYDGWEASV